MRMRMQTMVGCASRSATGISLLHGFEHIRETLIPRQGTGRSVGEDGVHALGLVPAGECLEGENGVAADIDDGSAAHGALDGAGVAPVVAGADGGPDFVVRG